MSARNELFDKIRVQKEDGEIDAEEYKKRKKEIIKNNIKEKWDDELQDWSCPSCKRTRENCSRWGHDQAHYQVVYHHDHIVEFIDQKVTEITNGNRLSQEQLNYLTRVKAFGQKFVIILVCEDCNLIEGVIKKHLKLDKYFTFELSTLLPYCTITDGLMHTISDENLQLIEKEILPNLLLEFKSQKRIVGGLVRAMIEEDLFFGEKLLHAYKPEARRVRKQNRKKKPRRPGVSKEVGKLWDDGYSVNEIYERIDKFWKTHRIVGFLIRKRKVNSMKEALDREDLMDY